MWPIQANNTTRFVVMSREPLDPDPGQGPVITSFVFRVRSVPAALYKALGGFATNGVNITKLESYIVDGSFTVAQFYADIDGHPDAAAGAPGAGGAGVLLPRGADPRRLSGLAAAPRPSLKIASEFRAKFLAARISLAAPARFSYISQQTHAHVPMAPRYELPPVVMLRR